LLVVDGVRGDGSLPGTPHPVLEAIDVDDAFSARQARAEST
jgi:hypothetical protein